MRVYSLLLVSAAAMAGCNAADDPATPPVMTQSAHDHYHVHAADVSHGHDHDNDARLAHDHPHDH